jgi:hypothetical protein
MATRRLNRRQTNTVLAGAMSFALALAIAFFVIAMPKDIFEGLVLATGLPSVLAAAAPPLGETARLIVAALTGGIAGIAVLASFLFTARLPQKQTSVVRPFVASDLDFLQAKPADVIKPEFDAVLDLEPLSESMQSAPPSIVEAEAIEVLAETPAAVEKAAEEAPLFLDFKAMRAVTPPANDPPALDLAEWKVAAPERKPEPGFKPEIKKPSRPITAPAKIAEDEPISALMQRLEAGLERRAVRGEAPAQPPAINRSGVGLRSTLDELRQMAVRR